MCSLTLSSQFWSSADSLKFFSNLFSLKLVAFFREDNRFGVLPFLNSINITPSVPSSIPLPWLCSCSEHNEAPCCSLKMLSISSNQGLCISWTLSQECSLPRYLQDLPLNSFRYLANCLLIREVIPSTEGETAHTYTYNHPCDHSLPLTLLYFSS